MHARLCGQVDGLEDVIENLRARGCMVDVTPNNLPYAVLYLDNIRFEGSQDIRRFCFPPVIVTRLLVGWT